LSGGKIIGWRGYRFDEVDAVWGGAFVVKVVFG